MTSVSAVLPLQLIQKAVESYVQACLKMQGDNFVAAIHFGSTAGKGIKAATDIDLLLIFKNKPQSSRERFRWSESFELEAKDVLGELKKRGYHVDFSPVFRTLAEIKQHFSVIYLDMVKTSQIVYDPLHEARDLILRTQKWIEKNGSHKVMRGTKGYWILKPGHDPEMGPIELSWDV